MCVNIPISFKRQKNRIRQSVPELTNEKDETVKILNTDEIDKIHGEKNKKAYKVSIKQPTIEIDERVPG